MNNLANIAVQPLHHFLFLFICLHCTFFLLRDPYFPALSCTPCVNVACTTCLCCVNSMTRKFCQAAFTCIFYSVPLFCIFLPMATILQSDKRGSKIISSRVRPERLATHLIPASARRACTSGNCFQESPLDTRPVLQHAKRNRSPMGAAARWGDLCCSCTGSGKNV